MQSVRSEVCENEADLSLLAVKENVRKAFYYTITIQILQPDHLRNSEKENLNSGTMPTAVETQTTCSCSICSITGKPKLSTSYRNADKRLTT